MRILLISVGFYLLDYFEVPTPSSIILIIGISVGIGAALLQDIHELRKD